MTTTIHSKDAEVTMSLTEFIEREDLIEELNREVKQLRKQLALSLAKPCNAEG